jgi:hypothetical protein
MSDERADVPPQYGALPQPPIPDVEKENERIIPTWSSKGVPNPSARIAGKILLGSIFFLFLWQLAARVSQGDAETEASWSPSVQISRFGHWLAPIFRAVSAWIATWADLWLLFGKIVDFIRPVVEASWQLIAAFFRFGIDLLSAIVGGFINAIMGDSNTKADGFTTNARLGIAILVAFTFGGTFLLMLETFGLQISEKLRPSYWTVVIGNAKYYGVEAIVSVYSFTAQLVFDFRDTILRCLRRIPGFDELVRQWGRAAGYVCQGVWDLMRAGPKAFMRTVDYFFPPEKKDVSAADALRAKVDECPCTCPAGVIVALLMALSLVFMGCLLTTKCFSLFQ